MEEKFKKNLLAFIKCNKVPKFMKISFFMFFVGVFVYAY